VPAVAFNNPYSAIVAWPHFQRRDGFTLKQVIKQIIVGGLGSLVVNAFIEAFLNVNVIQPDQQARFTAFDDFVVNEFVD
jgi:hypothetical protein